MRIVVADDEPLSRSHLEHLLRTDPRVEVVSCCADIRETREAIETHDPDAVFLDIEMPGPSGLELARDAEIAGRPLVVFVTAHIQYAYAAFDVAPVDYILKPAEPLRCRRAVTRVLRALERQRADVPAAPRASSLDQVFVKDGDRMLRVAIGDIEVVEAVGNYVKLRTRKQSYLLRTTLASLERRLDAAVFVRTHRSYMVNIRNVRELVPVSHGDYNVVLHDGTAIPLSRVYRSRILALALAFNAAGA